MKRLMTYHLRHQKSRGCLQRHPERTGGILSGRISHSVRNDKRTKGWW